MKHKFSKFLLALLMLGGIGLASCQKASHTASVPTNECQVKIVEDAQTHKRTAVITLGLLNDTIYNVEQVSLTYNVYNGNSVVLLDQKDNVDIFVRHGVAGYLSYTYQVPNELVCDAVKITHTEVTKYSSLFDTYMVPFIVMFVLAGFGIMFFAIDLFKGGITKEGVKELFREKMFSSLTIMALVVLICLIPLMFSSWVVTLILVGGFLGVSLVCGLLTLIRMAFLKK